MTEHNDSEDESTLQELRDSQERAERMHWDTGRIEDKLANREDRQDLLLRRKQLSDLANDRAAPPATRETAEREVSEIDELLAEPLEAEAAEKREMVDALRVQAENMAHRQGFEDAANRAKDRADALEAEAEALEAKAAGEAEAETLSESGTTSGRSWGGRDHSLSRSDPVNVAEYLRVRDVDPDEIDEDKVESLLNNSLSGQIRDKGRIYEAAKRGRKEVPADEFEDRGIISLNHGV